MGARIALIVAASMLLTSSSMAQTSAPNGSAPAQPDPVADASAAVSQPAPSFSPMSASDRAHWIVDGTVGVMSLTVVGPLSVAFDTWVNYPHEWQRTWEGAGKRYAEREADVTISNTIEAGLGALWGEQARYTRSNERELGRRLGHALKTVFLAERRDGHLAPAWARYAGNTVNNVIENAWLPPSMTTWEETAVRSATGLLSRAAANLWEEFWPDARRRLFKR
jgi:hypothetical protein